MNNTILIPTGYMGTGSSAVTDILFEIERNTKINKDFEFVFLHTPDGVFDLEDKLLKNNNAIRSDEAIRSFLNAMSELYDNIFYWPGDYKKNISKNFKNYYIDFVNSIVLDKYKEAFWYNQQKPNIITVPLMCIRKAVKELTNKSVILKNPLNYKGMYLAFPDEKEFYYYAKKFIYNVLNDYGLKKQNVICDQLLLPHNLYRINNYFDDNVRVIVVDRDPRDLYILNKYYWSKKNSSVPYPINVNDFCLVYKKIREKEIKYIDKKILRINFEDLIYRNSDTINRIYDFVEVKRENHINKGKYFDVNKSINNTQLFMIDNYKKESEIIEKKLPQYLYKFEKTYILHNEEVIY